MKRVYTGWKNSYVKFLPNKVMSYLIEGIQLNGGEIISFQMVPISTDTIIERILIVYEDNGHYEDIMKFLEGKEDNILSWVKSIE